MHIWRVENRDGKGPYSSWSCAFDNLNENTHPEPYKDIPEWGHMEYEERREFHFGFRSSGELTRWFDDKTLSGLYKEGFIVSVYITEPSNVIFGSKQLIFKKSLSKLTWALNLCSEMEKCNWKDYLENVRIKYDLR